MLGFFKATLIMALAFFFFTPCCADIASALSRQPSRPLPVFPGAAGFGIETPAGRGGKVIRVTNLKDSGTGSLRAALEERGPRIIVFEVGGQIELMKELKIKTPFVTVAGQTAPSPGVTLKGAGLIVLTHDVLIQHLRIRVGADPKGPKPTSRDGLRISGRLMDVYNVVCDHLSVSWALDENLSTVGGVHDITISNSIFSEALKSSLHPKGIHSMGALIRENSRNVAVIGNLFAHNMDRNPRITGGTSVALMNNLMYNSERKRWIELDIGNGDQPHRIAAVGNVFIEGPNTPHYAWPVEVAKECLPGTKLYLSDNVASGSILKHDGSLDVLTSSPPVWHESLKPRPGRETKSWVLSNAGAYPFARDDVDARIVREVLEGKGRIIDNPAEVSHGLVLSKKARPLELPKDPNGDDDGDGYTNIEELLHKMAADVEGVNQRHDHR